MPIISLPPRVKLSSCQESSRDTMFFTFLDWICSFSNRRDNIHLYQRREMIRRDIIRRDIIRRNVMISSSAYYLNVIHLSRY